jgi:hypothetical protein
MLRCTQCCSCVHEASFKARRHTFAIAIAKSLDSSTRPLVEGAAAAAAVAAMHILLLLVVGEGRAAIQLRGCHWLMLCRLQDAAAEILRLCTTLATTSCCCGATVLLRSCAE